MRVGMYYNNHDIRSEDVPTPKIGPGEILMRVEASGVCGSDLMEWYRIPKAPIVLGHEVGGEVVEVGDGVKDFEVGDKITATHHVPCNTCHYCLTDRHTICPNIKSTFFDPGGFSEYIRIPSINVDRGVFKLPGNVSTEEGSFTEPLGCVVRGQRMMGFDVGSSVLIIGSGITGLLNLQYAKAQGSGTTIATDINEYKLQTALRFGADYAVNSKEDVARFIKEKNEGRLADIVIVCTGSGSAIQSAMGLVEKGGKILFFAPSDPEFKLTIPFNDYWWSGVSITSSYAASPSDLLSAINLIKSKRIDVKSMITHTLPLKELSKGFRLVEEGKSSIKVIIDPRI